MTELIPVPQATQWHRLKALVRRVMARLEPLRVDRDRRGRLTAEKVEPLFLKRSLIRIAPASRMFSGRRRFAARPGSGVAPGDWPANARGYRLVVLPCPAPLVTVSKFALNPYWRVPDVPPPAEWTSVRHHFLAR